MALRGVWQLEKLIVSYCNWGGSSRGIRAFMENHLPTLKEKNPQLEVLAELSRGQHPFLKGLYKNKNERVCLCEESYSGRDIIASNKAKECTWKKGDQAQNKPCHEAPEGSGHLDRRTENLS